MGAGAGRQVKRQSDDDADTDSYKTISRTQSAPYVYPRTPIGSFGNLSSRTDWNAHYSRFISGESDFKKPKKRRKHKKKKPGKREKVLEKHISTLERLCQCNGLGPGIDTTDFIGNDETENVLKQILFIEDHIRTKNKELMDARQAIQVYLTRLSTITGDILSTNKPNDASLCDDKRPTKLAEEYSSIYNNEWTAVMTILKQCMKKTSRRRRTLYLFTVLKAVYLCCKKMAEKQLQVLAEHLFLLKNPSYDQINAALPGSFEQKLITDYRKTAAEDRIAFLKKTIRQDPFFLQEIFSCEDLENEILVKVYDSYFFDKCIEICWRFVIQDPPMFLDINEKEGISFEQDLYTEYTRGGFIIEYVVWPVLYLYEGGPILSKGVAQPKAVKDLND